MIGPARADELDAICAVVEAAFGRRDEAALVRALVADGAAVVSLVARDADGRIEGHVLYSALHATAEDGTRIAAVALAPVSVLPARQSAGLGAALIAAGDAACAVLGFTLAVVLGNPAYYSRFGYDVDAARAFETPYAGPYLMAKALGEADLPEGAVSLVYPAAFG
jgi:putative acetyltransferase